MTLPVIITEPVPRLDVQPGEAVTFSVTASGAQLTYQWQREGENIDDSAFYTGTNTASLQVVSAREPEDEGMYLCIVGNPVGLVTSDPARLEIG